MTKLPFSPVHSNDTANFPAHGFASLRFALTRCIERPSPSASEGGEPVDALTALLAQAENDHWPFVLEALCSGLLEVYVVLPGGVRKRVEPELWSHIQSERLPETIRWRQFRNLTPWVRVGDMEWLLPARTLRPKWTADQALMWICSREADPVRLASPIHRDGRLTWPLFSSHVTFPVVLRAEALRALRGDILGARLSAFSGLRQLSVDELEGAEWHRASVDAFSYWTLRTPAGHQHGVVFDAAEVDVLYPSRQILVGTVPPEPASHSDLASPAADASLPSHRQSEDRLRARLRQMTQAWVDAGQIPADRPGEKDVVEAGASFGVKRDAARAIWKEVRGFVDGVDWSAPGRKSKA